MDDLVAMVRHKETVEHKALLFAKYKPGPTHERLENSDPMHICHGLSLL